ncbi:MAG: hypothetical protein IKK24_03850 [Clostridia bacterium]|nr:hypothetical protein [Clostridia bacterium]
MKKLHFRRLISLLMVMVLMLGIFAGCGKSSSTDGAEDEQIVDLDGFDQQTDADANGDETSSTDKTQEGNDADSNKNNTSGSSTGNKKDKVTPIKLGGIDLKGRKIVVYDHNRISTGLTKDKTSQLGKKLQERITAIEKKYNCKWVWNTASADTINASIAAGKPVVDIMDIGGPHLLPNLYTSGFLTPLKHSRIQLILTIVNGMQQPPMVQL